MYAGLNTQQQTTKIKFSDISLTFQAGFQKFQTMRVAFSI